MSGLQELMHIHEALHQLSLSCTARLILPLPLQTTHLSLSLLLPNPTSKSFLSSLSPPFWICREWRVLQVFEILCLKVMGEKGVGRLGEWKALQELART